MESDLKSPETEGHTNGAGSKKNNDSLSGFVKTHLASLTEAAEHYLLNTPTEDADVSMKRVHVLFNWNEGKMAIGN